MDSKLVLIKLITLLYCESLCVNIPQRSNELAKEIISRLKLPEQMTETDTGRQVIVGLRETVLWMIDSPQSEPFEYNALLQRVRMNAGEDFVVFQAFEDVESYNHLEAEAMIGVCRTLHHELKGFTQQWAIREIIHKAHRELFYNNKPMDWRKYVDGLVADLETYASGWTKDQQDFIINLVNMNDPTTMKTILEKAKEDNEGVGGFTTGWKAMNRMFGQGEQMRRGMFVLIGALTHNYKSGLAHDLFRHFCIHNDPQHVVEGKKPTILYFSSENRAEEDLSRMYIALKENETGVAVDISQVCPDEMSGYVSKRLCERGWDVSMLRINPHTFTYSDLFNTVLDMEAKGHDIHAIVFDYLSLINKQGCQSSMIGEDTRQLMQRVRTFMSSRNILFITPHQLSQEAMSLKRAGVANFVSEIAGKNYWDGSKRIANEADLEIFLDIVEYDKRHYLAVHRGKHRTVKATPKRYQHFYLPFQEIGYIPDDIHKEDSSLERLVSADAASEITFD